jgi:hypothetical protein
MKKQTKNTIKKSASKPKAKAKSKAKPKTKLRDRLNQKLTPLMQSFVEDLRKMQTKYPMCIVDGWTPIDFEYALHRQNDPDVQIGDVSPNWEDDRYLWAAEQVDRYRDANIGISWNFLSAILSGLHEA